VRPIDLRLVDVLADQIVPVGRAQFTHADRIGLLGRAIVLGLIPLLNFFHEAAGEGNSRLIGTTGADQERGERGTFLVEVPLQHLSDLIDGPLSRHRTPPFFAPLKGEV
jgi:hypothetical protein